MDKLKKNSKVKTTAILSESQFFKEKDMISTDVPMINVALSGSIDGGLAPGLTVLAGPSKHFKTSFALKMAAASAGHTNDGRHTQRLQSRLACWVTTAPSSVASLPPRCKRG